MRSTFLHALSFFLIGLGTAFTSYAFAQTSSYAYPYISCPTRYCMNSAQCASGERCSTERGDCRSACNDPRVKCMQVCMGICEPQINPTTNGFCGNGICDVGETGFPVYSPILTYCPQDCPSPNVPPQPIPFPTQPSQPICGNRICEAGENQGGIFSCTFDCGSTTLPPPPPGPKCGNRICEAGENQGGPQSCIFDCGEQPRYPSPYTYPYTYPTYRSLAPTGIVMGAR
jgi:hypothetical protein